MEMDIVRGTIFIKLEGEMTEKSYMILEKKINQLLYEYGMHSFVFNFSYLNRFDDNIFSKIQNKVIEILLSCGKVIFCGLGRQYHSFSDKQKRLIYVDNEMEAFNQIN